ncbi:MAG: phosphatidylserine decarboxylase [Sulfuriflexus sp.]|nr:phosphatidylserine decarboxylase [Sulfuriflexus sp.]
MALTNRHQLIASEGHWFIAAAVILASVASYYFGAQLMLPIWLLPALLVFMFRDPTRKIPPKPLAVLSPVAAEVLAIENVRDGFIDRDAKKIVLGMGVFDIYSIRSPIEGKVVHQWYVDKETAVSDAPQFAQWIKTDEGDDVLLAIYRGRIMPRPRCYVQIGERLGQGQRCGFMSFGARIEVYVPITARIDVEVGQRLIAGEHSLASFIHHH